MQQSLQGGNDIVGLGERTRRGSAVGQCDGHQDGGIADEAELTVEARALDEPALERFAERLAHLDVGLPLRLEVEIIGRRPAGRLDRGSPLLEAVRAVREELGLPDALGEGSTDGLGDTKVEWLVGE